MHVFHRSFWRFVSGFIMTGALTKPRVATGMYVAVVTLCLAAVSRADVFDTVDLSSFANARIQTYQPSAAGYPEGAVTLGGVPFNIQTAGGNNAWNAEFVAGPQPHTLDVPLNISNATTAYSLINTFYGQPGPDSYVKVEFFGTGGAYFSKDLIGNVDVRDHFNGFWTNTINGTSTVNVYSSGGGFLHESRLDMQTYSLPASFLGQTLTDFRLTSIGGVGISDASIQGLTIQQAAAVPEPGSLTLFSLIAGLGTVIACRRWREVVKSIPGGTSRSRLKPILLASIALICCALAGPAAGDTVVDQSLLINQGNFAQFGPNAGIAQSFEQIHDNITGASVQTGVNGAGTGSITIDLYSDLPNAGGVLLATGSVANVAAGSLATVSFGAIPVSITPDHSYFLVFSGTNPNMAVASTDGLGGGVDLYTRGQGYHSNFTPILRDDINFQTFASIQTPEPCTLALWSAIAGLGAATTSIRRCLR